MRGKISTTRWAALWMTVAALGATVLFGPASSARQPADAEPPIDAKEGFLRAKLAHMTLEEKVGQLFFTFVQGKHADDATGAAENQANYGVDTPGEVVRKYHLGGVLYFDAPRARNIANPTQVNAFSNSLQEDALDSGAGTTLRPTIDQ